MQRLLAVLSADKRPLYAVLDTARSPRLAPWLTQRSGVPHVSLFTGVKAVTLENVAPYLLTLDADAAALPYTVEMLWGKHCVLFLNTELNHDSLRLELKRFMAVETPDGAQGLLRFYDPRVWHRLIAISTEQQRRRFFANGAIRYVCEKNMGDTAVEYWYEQSAGFMPLIDESIRVHWRAHALNGLQAVATN